MNELHVIASLREHCGRDVASISSPTNSTNRARQLYKNISMLFLFPVKDGKLSTGVNATLVVNKSTIHRTARYTVRYDTPYCTIHRTTLYTVIHIARALWPAAIERAS